MTVASLTCFKAYDIRGQLGAELNENIAYRIGRAYAQFLDAKRIVIGGDMRLSTAGLKQALANGLMDAGCDVIDLVNTVLLVDSVIRQFAGGFIFHRKVKTTGFQPVSFSATMRGWRASAWITDTAVIRSTRSSITLFG